MKRHDFFPPIIADADAGFGGTSSVMKIVKLMIEVIIIYIYIF